MRFATEIEIGGEMIPATLPSTMREVIVYRHFIDARIVQAAKDPAWEGFGDAVAWAVEWLAQYLDRPADWIDENISLLDIRLACLDLIALAGNLPDIADEIQEHGRFRGEGGCSCKICEDPEAAQNWDDKTYEIWSESCKFRRLSIEASGLVGLVHGLEGVDVMNTPYFVYHARESYQIGYSYGVAKRMRKEEQRRKFHDRLSQAGLKR